MVQTRRELFINWMLIVMVSLLYFFANLQKILIPGAVFDELQKHFQTEAAPITRLNAVFMYIYSLCQLLTGVLADRYSGTRVVIAGGALMCVGSLLSALDSSLMLLTFSRFLTGMGASCIYLCMVKMVARISGNAFTLVLGVVMLVGYSGSVAGGAPFVAMVERFGYSRSMLAIGIVTAFFYAIFVATGMAAKLPAIRKDVKIHWATYLKASMQKHNVCIWFTVGVAFSVFYSIQTVFGKKFLEDFCGVTPTAGGMVMSAAMIIAAINGFLVASLSRMCGNRRRIFAWFGGFGSLAGCLIFLLCTASDLHNLWIYAGAWILLAFAGNIGVMTTALMRDTNSEDMLGTVLSISNCLAYLLIAVIGNIGGYLMDIFPPELSGDVKIYGRNSYMMLFSVLVAMSMVSAFCSCRLKESFGRPIKVD